MGKTLIAYYSYTNNTKKVAEQIQKATGADICKIEKVCKNSDVTNSIDIRFDTDKMVMPKSNLEKWIASLQYN